MGKIKSSDENNTEIVIKSPHISLLSSLVRSHENNENVFKKSGGLGLLSDFLSCDDFTGNSRIMTKMLFFYKNVATKEEIEVGLDSNKLFELFQEDMDYSRMLVEIYGGEEKFEEKVEKRKQILK